MIARKNRGVNPRFFFLRGFLDALARVPVAPLGYRLRVAPGPRLPRRSLACGRFAPGAQIGLSRKRAKRPRPHWGLGGLAAASRSAFAPRGALKRFGPAPPPGVALRSTKGQGLRLRPASPPLLFFASRSRVSFCGSFACALSPLSWAGSPPPGPSYRRSLFSRLRWPAPFGLPRAFRRRGSRLVAIAPGARCAPLPPRRFFLRVLPLPFQPPPRPANLGGGRKEVMRVFFAL